MVKVIEVKKWDTINPTTDRSMFYVRLLEEKDIFEIAETLNLPFIYQKKKELMTIDGYMLFWYKP